MHGTIWLAQGRATVAEVGTGSGGLGGIPLAEGRTKWRSLIEDICFDALRSARGSFEFHPEDETNIPAGPRIDLTEVVEAGKKRLELWREVESVIHSFEAVPRLAESLSDDSLTISQDKWRILVALDGRRNVAILARRLDIELLEFCQMLKPMIESGAVILDQPEGFMKSLPKVRLDVAGREGDWTESSGGPLPEGTPILSVGSTVPEAPVRSTSPFEGRTGVDSEPFPGQVSAPVDLLTDEDSPGADETTEAPIPRRRLRRSRARNAGAHSNG